MKKTSSKSYSLYVGKRRTLRFTHVPEEVVTEAVMQSGAQSGAISVRAQPTEADFQVMRDHIMRLIWPVLAFGLVALSIMGAAEVGGYNAAFLATRFG